MIKQVVWRGNSRNRIKSFPSVAQDIAGHELMKVQMGKMPANWRFMSNVAPGAIEIRVHNPHEHRIIYVANYPEAIYVLHCFEKKTRSTPLKEIETARREYAALQKYRREHVEKTGR